jgi:hypothetical protein
MRPIALAVSLAALSLIAGESPAAASVTIGQTGISTEFASDSIDRVQPTVTSGNSYIVPATGGIASWTVTSWSTNAKAGTGQILAMKMYRPLGGTFYSVVGHDGPRPLTGGGLNTFPGISIAVKAGDVLGLSTPAASGSPGTVIPPAGDHYFFHPGVLADGASGDFPNEGSGGRLNVSAVLVPSNDFTLGDIDRNKKKGTATLTVNVPNPGELTASGKGAKAAAGARISKAVGSGAAQLLIKAKGKKKRKLKENGKVKLSLAITYTPTGGDPSTQSRKLKLKKI